MILRPPNMGQRALPQPRRPQPYWTDDYEAGYDAGFTDALCLRCPYVRQSDEGTAYCSLAEGTA